VKTRGHSGSWIGALAAAVVGLLGMGAPAQAGTVPVDQAPEAWVLYAQRISAHFQTALEGETAAAQRFHAFLEQRASSDAAADSTGVPVVLSIRTWISAAGRVTQVEFTPLGDPQADADLRQLLRAQSVGHAPPPGMRQPVVVRVSLSAQL
jgi:hypothetical protein